MICTCYGANNPNCEKHGQRQARPTAPPKTVAVAPDSAELVMGDPTDKKAVAAYDHLLAKLRKLAAELRNEGYEEDALMLVAVDGEGRVLVPIVLQDSDARDIFPSILDTVAKAMRRRIAN